MTTLWLLAAAAAFGQTMSQPAAKAMQMSLSKQQASIALQREAVSKQAAAAATWLAPWGSAPATAEPQCEALAEEVVAPIIENTARTEHLEPKLLRAVIEQESAFRPCAVSSKGALGLMQLMPASVQQLEVQDPFDPKESIEGGAKFLKQLIDRYHGDLPEALGAYNAGPVVVDQVGGVPDIPETRSYVDSILKKMGITRTVPPSIPKPKPIEN